MALSRTLENLRVFPRAGEEAFFETFAIAGLRRIILKGFEKYLLYDIFEGDQITVLRVVHGAMDQIRELRKI